MGFACLSVNLAQSLLCGQLQLPKQRYVLSFSLGLLLVPQTLGRISVVLTAKSEGRKC